MADIISLNAKLQDVKEKKEVLVRKRKLAAIRSVFQDVRRTFRCEKCYRQVEADPPLEDELQKMRVPYRFCGSCTDEYIDYIERLKGKGDTDCYWHNDAWLDVWHHWIDYQGSMDYYLKTKEFKELLQELKEPDPE